MEIVLVGRSNVGKSSVIRQLTGKRVRVGKRPGVTRRLARYRCGDLELVDLPGFGFMGGLPQRAREEVKAGVVRYLERNRSRILFAIEVLDAKLFLEIAERWEKRGQIPVDIEMFSFLRELGLNPVIAVNKIDVIYPHERDPLLDRICERLGMSPPWRQWRDTLVPLSAKTGEGMGELRRLIGERLTRRGRGRSLKYFRKRFG